MIPLQSPNGYVDAILGISRHITERKRAEAALYRANASLEARVSKSCEINKALINDIGIQRATGILYESGWNVGLEEARPVRAAWKGDARSFAEDFFERNVSAISLQVNIMEFDAGAARAMARLCRTEIAQHAMDAADAEMVICARFIAAVLSVAFKSRLEEVNDAQGIRPAPRNRDARTGAYEVNATGWFEDEPRIITTDDTDRPRINIPRRL